MIYIGTSGFSYDDWKGYFYPEKTNKKDMLSYYARAFQTVEINSSYYAIPSARTIASMDRKTPTNFKFVIKAHKDMTHVEKPERQAFNMFLGAIQPIRDTGKLGCVLAQFPWSFKNTDENKNRLREFGELMDNVPTVIEFRNSGWVMEETFHLLHDLGLGFCCVDEPRLKGLMPPVTAVTSNIGYVRFHGRNAKQWWNHDEAHERYNYLYSEEELSEWVPKVNVIDAKAQDTYLFFNNHYQGKAAQNARMFASMLNIKLPYAEPGAVTQLTFEE